MRKIKLGSDEIFFGENSIDAIRNLPSKNKKVAIVMSGDTLEKVGLLDRLTENLEMADIEWRVYDKVGVEPDFKSMS